MADLFVHIYRFFNRSRLLFYLCLAGMTAGMVILASRIRFEENISGSIPKQNNRDLTGYVLENLPQTDKIVIDISLRDTSAVSDPELLISTGEALTDSLRTRFDTTLLKNIRFQASDELMLKVLALSSNHLPIFLDESDYSIIDSLISPARVRASMIRNYRLMTTPAGMVLKSKVSQDPLGITNPALEKLKVLNAGGNFEIYDGCVFTRDMRHLLVFVEPANPSSETSMNGKLVDGLNKVIKELTVISSGKVSVRYFGPAAVAVANARQIKRDIILTLTLSFGLIFILVGWYFKDFRARLLGLLPAFYGAGLALSVLYLTKGTISAISLGIGAVILGLIVDYAMYFMNEYRKSGDLVSTLRDMTHVIMLCALTTAGALLCLTFLNSTVLRDLGWFSLLSVVGAALFTLIILPQFVHLVSLMKAGTGTNNFIDRLGSWPYHEKKWLIVVIVIVAIISVFFAGKARFEQNMDALNFMTPELKKAESDLDRISNYKLKNVFLVSTGPTIQEALRNRDRIIPQIQAMLKDSLVQGISDAGPLLMSDSLQQVRIDRWNRFWSSEKKTRVINLIDIEAKAAGFRNDAFRGFESLLNRRFQRLTSGVADSVESLTGDWISGKPGMLLVPTILRVKEHDKEKLYRSVRLNENYVIFDKQSLTKLFVAGVKTDFDRLVTLSMIFVTLLLILSYGRIGLGLMTAVPMFGSWLITLGFMGLTGSTFNIFNIILSSFIFGLGVDHSILMMRGLQRSLKYGTNELSSYRVSVILSSGATLFGAGAMFLARHPALHSIALISLVGMITVVMLSFTVQPLIFNTLILDRSRKGRYPVTFRIFIKTMVTWFNIVFIAVILMIAGTLIKFLLPLKSEKKELIFQRMFSWLSRLYISFTFAHDQKLINEKGEDFTKPAIIISNHQSLIETPAFIRLHPKILILTNDWVYRSPVFGPIARLASFFNVDAGIDAIIEPMRKKVARGYSILVFPEAHRSSDHNIQRFHRGAFYLAEKLQIDILPVVVFGTGDFLGKSEFWGRPNSLSMKILDRVAWNDATFGSTYQERSRSFRQFYIDQYRQFKAEHGDPHYYRRILALNYTLKGPVLEWYMRTKLRLENNYAIYHQLIPRSGRILDLGCGYGFISYMLMFASDDRRLVGIDYDEEKIAVASNNFSHNERISFRCEDISQVEIEPSDGIILSDVLHYLTPEDQHTLLQKCFMKLNPNGVILIREANAELSSRHRRSKLTEFLSTRFTGFNKTSTSGKELFFTSAGQIERFAIESGLNFDVIDNKKVTSNNLFVLRKNAESEILHR